MNNNYIKSIVAIIITFIFLGLIYFKNLSVLDGTRIANPNRYYLRFSKMNGVNYNSMPLKKGDKLSFKIKLEKGIINITLKDSKDKTVYSQTGIEKSSINKFNLNINKKDKYKVIITSKNAKGMIDIKKK